MKILLKNIKFYATLLSIYFIHVFCMIGEFLLDQNPCLFRLVTDVILFLSIHLFTEGYKILLWL